MGLSISDWGMPEGGVRRRRESHPHASGCTRQAPQNAEVGERGNRCVGLLRRLLGNAQRGDALLLYWREGQRSIWAAEPNQSCEPQSVPIYVSGAPPPPCPTRA